MLEIRYQLIRRQINLLYMSTIENVEIAPIGGHSIGIAERTAVNRGLAATVDRHLGHRTPWAFKDVEVSTISCKIVGATGSGKGGNLGRITDENLLNWGCTGIKIGPVCC